MRCRAVALLLLLSACGPAPRAEPLSARAPEGVPDRSPSVLVIVTDDQRWDTLNVMPTVRARIARHGVRLTRAYVTNPSCCPSRASMLTGDYSHTTGVWQNSGEHGGFTAFDDDSTLATWLEDAGYRTGLFGKYMNGYSPRAGYVPPGWETWFAIGEGFFYDYVALDVQEGSGRTVTFGDRPSDYSTRVLTRRARSFISSTPPDTPFFAIVAYQAPHAPATPDPRDVTAFQDLQPHRPPSFDERNVADKPPYIRSLRRLSRARERAVDDFRRDQLQSLLAVDRGVGRLLSTLRHVGRLHDTMVIFTSDHGIQWGEHRWVAKGVPYEESIRVPLVVRFDALVAERNVRTASPVLGIDLAPTVAEIAGIPAPPVDGATFASLLVDPTATLRESFIVEHRATGERRHPTFCAVRMGPWSFVRYYRDGVLTDIELYDLASDPFQLRNRADSPSYAAIQAMLEAEADALCVVPPV